MGYMVCLVLMKLETIHLLNFYLQLFCALKHQILQMAMLSSALLSTVLGPLLPTTVILAMCC